MQKEPGKALLLYQIGGLPVFIDLAENAKDIRLGLEPKTPKLCK